MPLQPNISITQGFSKGQLTEFTGLNYPEDALIDAQNCVFERVGNAHRRPGINYEANFGLNTIDLTGQAINTYKWNNVGGDGSTQLIVTQVGGTLYFWTSSAATITSPLSTQKLASTVDVSSFVASGGSFDVTLECQFTDGNGYLFVFHPNCDPIYCTYNAGTITGNTIRIQIRDFLGIPETGITDDFRPVALTSEHSYNLQNQGWTNAAAWTATSTTSNNTNTGSHTWTIQTGLTISAGQTVNVTTVAFGHGGASESGTVTSYNSGTGSLVINVTSTSFSGSSSSVWTFTSVSTSKITDWQTALTNYPANSDIWWLYKNASGTFDPTTMIAKVTQDISPAPKGHFILSAFQQQRSSISSIGGLTDVTTLLRPSTGCWFQGRVFYTGINASQQATGDAQYFTWTENVYFSQIITNVTQFGKCYQVEDPTSESTFDLLPSDGGVITIQGSGPIYKLFPIQNGLLVFAANGVWFITGSQGIGFTANDYTVAKESGIQSISSTSFVDVQGMPMWWNEEGIYHVTAGQQNSTYGAQRGAQAGMQVQSLTFSTIQTPYQNIPLSSKKYVRGIYDPLNWEVRWIYRTTEAADAQSRYRFDGALTLNTATQAFYFWNISTPVGGPKVRGITYVQGPGGSTSPDPTIKYFTGIPNGATFNVTFAEENDTTRWVDWHSSGTDTNFTSYFITGYKLHGKALYKWQPNFIYVFSNNTVHNAYKIQGIWDYAISGNSGKYSSIEVVDNARKYNTLYGSAIRRHRIRGRGNVLQFKISSVDGAPFNVFGWAIDEKITAGV